MRFSTDAMSDLFDEAVALGWTWTQRGSGHIIMRPPLGEGYMPLSVTHAGTRAVLNNRSNLNRWKRRYLACDDCGQVGSHNMEVEH